MMHGLQFWNVEAFYSSIDYRCISLVIERLALFALTPIFWGSISVKGFLLMRNSSDGSGSLDEQDRVPRAL